MITDRTGRHAVLLPINLKYEKICDVFFFFLQLKIKNKIFREFLLTGKEKKIYIDQKCTRDCAYGSLL